MRQVPCCRRSHHYDGVCPRGCSFKAGIGGLKGTARLRRSIRDGWEPLHAAMG